MKTLAISNTCTYWKLKNSAKLISATSGDFFSIGELVNFLVKNYLEDAIKEILKEKKIARESEEAEIKKLITR